MRVAFFGTPRFAVPTLERLLASRHAVVAVVTQLDRPSGRGQRLTEGPVKAVALARKVPVLQPDRLRTPEFLDRLGSMSLDLGVVAAYGKILPEPLIGIPSHGVINVHASLLPRWRGAAPIERAVMAGDRETGVTIMRIVRELDAGPMFAAIPRAIAPDETAEDVERDLAVLGADLLLEVVDRIAEGRAQETPQDAALVTYAPRLTKEEGLIDWSQPALAIHNKVRGLHPWPHAYTFLGADRYIVLRTWPEPDAESVFPPGTVLGATADRLTVATGAGALHVRQIQPEGRRPMDIRQFLAGHRLPAGARFEMRRLA